MQWQTDLHIPPFTFRIDQKTPIVSIGSCFSVHMARHLAELKFNVLDNPFGTLFNPWSIHHCIATSLDSQSVDKSLFVTRDAHWVSLAYHSDLKASTKEALQVQIIERQSALRKQLSETSALLLITLGSAFVYRHTTREKRVGNCHKLPASEFEKELLSVDEIKHALTSIIAAVQSEREDHKIIFSLSPVRHLRDGMIENARSKANLLSALHQVIDDSSNAFYFPSFELFMDELRDYRFYADDMLHPSSAAIEYTWKRFSKALLTDDLLHDEALFQKIQKAMQHQIVSKDEVGLKNVQSKFLAQVEELQGRYPAIDFSKELAFAESLLH